MRGKDVEKATKKLFDTNSKRLTKEAIEACEVTGINPNDLYEKNLDYFIQTANDPEIAQMRFDHFEKRRKDKLSIVLS